MTGELLSVGEVAAKARLSNQAVYRAIRAGELRAHRLRSRLRVEEADFELWLDESRVPAIPHRESVSGKQTPSHNPRGLRRLLVSESNGGGQS